MTANMSSNVESQSSELPRKTSTKTSEHRRATKPIMEKKRRARINNSLNELKVLILDALNKDPSRHSKLEKADILEMTVRHLQSVQRQQMASAISTDPNVLNKYRAGFNECATEVSRYIGRVDGVEQQMKQRILSHLNACVNSLNAAANIASNSYSSASRSSAFPGMMPPTGSPFTTTNSPLHVQIPIQAATAAALASGIFPNSSSGLTTNLTTSAGMAGMPGMTTNGDINNNSSLITTPSISLDSKPSLATPPSSASSTGSSHFTFTIPLHQCSPPLRNHLLPYHHNLNVNINQNSISGQMPSATTATLIFRPAPANSWVRNPCLESPIGQSSISPSGSSVGSGQSVGQLSPSESEPDFEMVLEPIPMTRNNSLSQSSSGDSVWRPW